MFPLNFMAFRPARYRSRKPSKTRTRLLRSEMLEPRTLLSGTSLTPLSLGAAAKTTNAAPTVAQPVSVADGTTIAGTTATLSVLGSDDGGETKLIYTWSVATAPSGGTVKFSANGNNAAKLTTATFVKPGTYNFSVKILDNGGLSVTATKAIVVSDTLTSMTVTTSTGQAVTASSLLNVAGTSQGFQVHGVDQFGAAMSTLPALSWTTPSLPLNAAAPKFTTTAGVTTVGFSMAG
jgi:hypothetical protein